MIREEHGYITYQDNNKKFTVIVDKDETTQLNTITSLTGPGISGAVAQGQDTTDFLALMNYIYNDTL